MDKRIILVVAMVMVVALTTVNGASLAERLAEELEARKYEAQERAVAEARLQPQERGFFTELQALEQIYNVVSDIEQKL